MDSSSVDQFALPAVMTCAGMYQMAIFARAVGKARMKYKVSPPETNGPPEFIRIFRAHQNSLEFYTASLASLWVSSAFVHPIPASLAYAGYLYARSKYFHAYAQDSEKRIKPFKLSVKFLQVLIWMSLLGAGHKFLRHYGNIDLWTLLKGALPSLTN